MILKKQLSKTIVLINLELEEAIVIFLDGILLNTKNIFFELPISTVLTEIDKLIKNPYKFFNFLSYLQPVARSPARRLRDSSRKGSPLLSPL